MTKFTDDTPIAMLTVGQLKKNHGIDRILGNLTANQAPAELYFQREEILDWLQSESHPTIEQYCNNHIKH